MNTYQEQIIEKIIIFFKANGNEYDLQKVYEQFQVNLTEYAFFRHEMCSTYKLIQRKHSSFIYHLTENGIAFNGFDEMRNSQRLEKEGSKQLLWYNTENAKAAFDDYPEIKSRARNSFRLGLLSIVLSLLALLLQLMCKKPS